MKRFIFGMDMQHPAECTRMLRQRGYHAVVNGHFTPEAARTLEAEGLEMFLCFGAYSVDKKQEQLARDPFGVSREWFGSGCPNDHENAENRLNAVLEKALAIPQVRGIWADGARFASFASTEGADSFFTCFCPRCMRAMADLGLDAQAVRRTVGELMQSRRLTESGAPLIRQWLFFREKTVQAYMDSFATRVHALRPELLAGAFVFAPSLGKYVGQTAAACRSLDVVSHMLYRHYPHPFGVACLGHEWSALSACFGAHADGWLRLTEAPFAIARGADDLLTNGFEPEWAGIETARARKETAQPLWPILQLQDDRLQETARHAFLNGADAVGLFAYNHGPVPCFE